jgi:hypothetical protein
MMDSVSCWGYCSSWFFLLSVLLSLVFVLVDRSREACYRVAINLLIVALLFPTRMLGGSLRDRIFLMHLAKFQEATDILIKSEKAEANGNDFSSMVSLPSGYSDLNVKEEALVSSSKGNIVVRYVTRDSSALGHSGYMYRLDDDSTALGKEFPDMGYTRIAPHWFFFSQ